MLYLIKMIVAWQTVKEWRCMQIIKMHDVDAAVKILFEHAGPHFQEQVIKWGAVHADKRR